MHGIFSKRVNFVNENVWFQKISIPPPRKVTGNSKGGGGGGVKPRNFRGVEGVHGQLLFQRVKKHEKNKQHTIETKHEEILTYVVLKQKIKLLSIKMRFTSKALMFLFFIRVS